jgi:hypothetical protein
VRALSPAPYRDQLPTGMPMLKRRHVQ